MRAVEYATGMVKWSQPVLGRATLLYADGHLVVLTERGRLLLVEATPERYHVVADATPLLTGSEAVDTEKPSKSEGEARTEEGKEERAEGKALLAYPAWSPPVLSHGVLYLRGKGRLAAFELIPGIGR